MLWACSPHRHPFFSLQPMATPAATLARIASPLLELQGPLCSPGARVLLGVDHVLTQHLLWEVHSPEEVWVVPFANDPLPTILAFTSLQMFILNK